MTDILPALRHISPAALLGACHHTLISSTGGEWDILWFTRIRTCVLFLEELEKPGHGSDSGGRWQRQNIGEKVTLHAGWWRQCSHWGLQGARATLGGQRDPNYCKLCTGDSNRPQSKATLPCIALSGVHPGDQLFWWHRLSTGMCLKDGKAQRH